MFKLNMVNLASFLDFLEDKLVKQKNLNCKFRVKVSRMHWGWTPTHPTLHRALLTKWWTLILSILIIWPVTEGNVGMRRLRDFKSVLILSWIKCFFFFPTYIQSINRWVQSRKSDFATCQRNWISEQDKRSHCFLHEPWSKVWRAQAVFLKSAS